MSEPAARVYVFISRFFHDRVREMCEHHTHIMLTHYIWPAATSTAEMKAVRRWPTSPMENVIKTTLMAIKIQRLLWCGARGPSIHTYVKYNIYAYSGCGLCAMVLLEPHS